MAKKNDCKIDWAKTINTKRIEQMNEDELDALLKILEKVE